jgi:sulfide:quinone oxidoreductase
MIRTGTRTPRLSPPASPNHLFAMALSRRQFLKLSAAGLVGAVIVERSYRYFSQSTVRGKILIVGGGAAGITMAAYLAKRLRHDDITIIEPETTHRYQPGYTLIAAGLLTPTEIERPTASLVPSSVKWLQDRVLTLDPDKNRVVTAKNGPLAYDFLVVVPGCEADFTLIPGITQATLGAGNVHSVYDFEGSAKTRDALQKLSALKGGPLLFTDTYTKMKCGGAPKKVTLLAEDLLRQKGARDRFAVTYFNSEKVLMKPKVFGDRLATIYAERKIDVRYLHRLASVERPCSSKCPSPPRKRSRPRTRLKK